MYLDLKKTKQTFLIFFLLIVFSFAVSGLAEENASGDKNVFLDSDQDGLSDQEEAIYKTDPQNPDTDGDGYSDGTEVQSGYDPLKPAPDDRLPSATEEKTDQTNNDIVDNVDVEKLTAENSSDENLTEKLSAELAALISDTEENGSQAISLDQINSLIDETVNSEITFNDLPEIDESKIKIKKQDYSKLSKAKREERLKRDDEEYLSSVFYIVVNNLPHKISNQNDIEDFSKEIVSQITVLSTKPEDGMKYFEDLADRGEEILQQLSDIEVPEDMLDLHIRGLQLATYAISLRDTVKIDMNDPISSLVSLSDAQSLMTLSTDFMTDVENKMSELNLTNLLSPEQATSNQNTNENEKESEDK